jgi:hypothetical protein
MHLRLLSIACLAAALCGCATDDQPSGAASQPSSSRSDGAYRTGSRLPSYDPPGTAASREISAEDWNDARRTGGNQGSAR